MPQRCRECQTTLVKDENWSPSERKANSRICKQCVIKKSAEWAKKNPERVRIKGNAAKRARYRRNPQKFIARVNLYDSDPIHHTRKLIRLKEYYLKEKVLSIAHRGGTCVHCGET